MSATDMFLKYTQARLPLVQAPMAGIQDSALTIAACQAGALGSLPAAMLSAEDLRGEIHRIRAYTDAPFNLNFFAHQTEVPSEEVLVKWQVRLAPYYQEWQVKESAAGGQRQPFSAEQAQIVIDERIPIISFHFGLPESDRVAQLKRSGTTILASATTVEEARFLAAHGADIIIAQGLEAGGHRSMFLSQDLTTQLGTFSLLPQVAAAVELPVIAAGGISSPETVAAAQALGAAAVQVGTAFMLADEAKTRALHRTALQSARAEHTAITNLFSGGFARGIVNRFISELGPICPDAPVFPYAQTAVNPLKAAAEAAGSDEFSSLWAGQNAPLAKAGSATEIIERLMTGWKMD